MMIVITTYPTYLQGVIEQKDNIKLLKYMGSDLIVWMDWIDYHSFYEMGRSE